MGPQVREASICSFPGSAAREMWEEASIVRFSKKQVSSPLTLKLSKHRKQGGARCRSGDADRILDVELQKREKSAARNKDIVALRPSMRCPAHCDSAFA